MKHLIPPTSKNTNYPFKVFLFTCNSKFDFFLILTNGYFIFSFSSECIHLFLLCLNCVGVLTERSLGQVRLRELPQWLAYKTPSHPKDVVKMVQGGD